jgi:hypothetical protein
MHLIAPRTHPRLARAPRRVDQTTPGDVTRPVSTRRMIPAGRGRRREREWFVSTVRKCRVSLTTADGITHSVDVQGTSVFEVAAAGITLMREERWIEALPPDAVVRVEVQVAPVVHDVPLAALERWANGPSLSPRQELLKRPLRHT